MRHPPPRRRPLPVAPGAPAPVTTQPVTEEGVKASPVAKRVAADMGVALAAVPGTGPGGKITKSDVISYAEQGASGAPAAAARRPGE